MFGLACAYALAAAISLLIYWSAGIFCFFCYDVDELYCCFPRVFAALDELLFAASIEFSGRPPLPCTAFATLPADVSWFLAGGRTGVVPRL